MDIEKHKSMQLLTVIKANEENYTFKEIKLKNALSFTRMHLHTI